MSHIADLSGERFGRWEVLYRTPQRPGRGKYTCRCACGTVKDVFGNKLISGQSKSCGCLAREILSKRRRIHGEANNKTKTRLYVIWCHMIERCESPDTERYDYYGGRGIDLCAEWRSSYETFRNWALANGYSDELTIDRIDNNGNYEPSNCRWATHTEQMRNRRNNHMITYAGETKCMAQWADEIGMSLGTFKNRIYLGWSVQRAIETPVRGMRRGIIGGTT